MSNMINYLNAVDGNAAVREAYLNSPKAAMKMHGLSDAEQAALMSGDKQRVADLLNISVNELPSYIMLPSMN